MNHDEDDDLCMFDMGSWKLALSFALAAVLVVLVMFGAKAVYLKLLEAM